MRPEVLGASVGQALRGALEPLARRVAALEAGGPWAVPLGALEVSVATLSTSVATLAAREPLAGPPGPAGEPGPPGPAGRDGQDGRGLTYRGVHVAGQAYAPGDLVTAGGSAWYCHAPTTAAPGAGPDWQLMVKRGRDARGDRS